MSALAKAYGNDEDGIDMAHEGRLSSAAESDEDASLLRSREPGEKQRAADGAQRSQLLVLLLSISNAITIVTVLLLVLSYRSSEARHKAPATVIYPAQPEWFPPQIPVTKVMHGSELFGQPPNPESIKAWNGLLPRGRGWVTIKNETALPDMPGLNQSLPEHQAFPSVFHQLHCLYSTMDSYYILLDKLNGKDGGQGQSQKKEDEAGGKNNNYERELQPGDPGWENEHLNHCWDYLRQTIMCNADVTLEWRRYGEQVGTGWGYQHQCKDWDAIISWAERYRYSNSWGILRGGGERIPLGPL